MITMKDIQVVGRGKEFMVTYPPAGGTYVDRNGYLIYELPATPERNYLELREFVRKNQELIKEEIRLLEMA
jgi:hypothetical protein